MHKTEDWNTDWTYKRAPWDEVNPGKILEGEKVTLPHTWYRDGEYYQGDGVYQKVFEGHFSEHERVFVRFHGVDKVCRVYLNGTLLGAHEGGYTRFAFELTNVQKHGKNILSVFVNNEKGRTVSPLSGDFPMFGGIHRKVELITAPEVCFDAGFAGTEGVIVQTRTEGPGAGQIFAKVRLCGNVSGDYSLRFSLLDADGKCREVTEFPIPFSDGCVLKTANPHLWDGKRDPYLYTVCAELLYKGQVADRVTQRVGFRWMKLDPDRGFFLNGNHLKLHGVAKHQDTEGVFSAATEENWKTDIALIREIGANAVRLSHYPHPDRVYDLCDEAGLLVWAEIPLLKLTDNPELQENAKQQLREMILQNMHHPSICFWGIQNEIAIFGEKPYMAHFLQTLNQLVHTLDPTRLSVSANLNSVKPGSALNRITDGTAYNLYFGWYYGSFEDHGKFLDELHRANPKMPFAVSEYGADTNLSFHSANPKVNDYTEEFQCLYHERIYPQMLSRDFIWGSFVWNMFDFCSPIRHAANIDCRNLKGLVTYDRKTKKDSFYYYKAQWAREPFVHITEKRFQNRSDEKMTVKVYSNLPEVTLQTAMGSMTVSSSTGVFLFPNVRLSLGENRIKACSGAAEDTAIFVRCAEPDRSYIYVNDRKGFSVENWFVDEQQEARIFPEGCYSVRDKIEDLLACPAAMAVIKRHMPDVAADLPETIGRFSLDSYFSHEKPQCKERDIKELNEDLTKIRKKDGCEMNRGL